MRIPALMCLVLGLLLPTVLFSAETDPQSVVNQRLADEAHGRLKVSQIQFWQVIEIERGGVKRRTYPFVGTVEVLEDCFWLSEVLTKEHHGFRTEPIDSPKALNSSRTIVPGGVIVRRGEKHHIHGGLIFLLKEGEWRPGFMMLETGGTGQWTEESIKFYSAQTGKSSPSVASSLSSSSPPNSPETASDPKEEKRSLTIGDLISSFKKPKTEKASPSDAGDAFLNFKVSNVSPKSITLTFGTLDTTVNLKGQSSQRIKLPINVLLPVTVKSESGEYKESVMISPKYKVLNFSDSKLPPSLRFKEKLKKADIEKFSFDSERLSKFSKSIWSEEMDVTDKELASFDFEIIQNHFLVQFDDGPVSEAYRTDGGMVLPGWNKGKKLKFKLHPGSSIEENTLTISYWKRK